MIIEKNAVVSVMYELRDSDAQGEVLEVANRNEPFVFLFGAENVLPDFESNMFGLKEGDTFSFGIACEDAYGESSEDAVVGVPMDVFTIDGKIAHDLLIPGVSIPLRNEDGHIMEGVVLGTEEDMVLMDFNHPMAGRDLHFSGKILKVRPATPEEIAHGHVHGDGGHHH